MVKKIGQVPNEDNMMEVITTEHLKLMLNLYDQYFFSGALGRLSEQHGCKYHICWNDKCESTAGWCRGTCKSITIELCPIPFKKSIVGLRERGGSGVTSGGLACNDILSCKQLTFEHELVHALIRCFCQSHGYSKDGPGNWKGRAAPSGGHSKTFISIVNNTFGQTEYKHGLFTTVEERDDRTKRKEQKKADVKSLKSTFTLGETVTFTDRKGEEFTTIIKKLNPTRARAELTDGRTYTVPYSLLKKKA